MCVHVGVGVYVNAYRHAWIQHIHICVHECDAWAWASAWV